MFKLLGVTADNEHSLRIFQQHLVVFHHRRPEASRQAYFKTTPAVMDLVWSYLGHAGRAYTHLGDILFAPDFEPCSGQAVHYRLLREVTLATVYGDLPDRLPNELQDLNPHAALARMPNIRVHDACQRSLGETWHTAGRHCLPEVAGRIHHPVYGTPAGVWLRPPAPKVAKPGPTVVDLVDRFHLDPESRDAYGVYLCGAFHAVSLESPRPILLVDSWTRGIGKSCLCACVARLLDRYPSSVQLSGRGAEDRITAHLATGARALVGGNVDGRVDFHPIQLTHLSTDGGHSERLKYGKTTTRFDGVIPMLNVVYGSASLHIDIVRRSLRVELQGRTIVKGEGTTDLWCRDHRESIIASILSAHADADHTDWPLERMPPDCRFEDFLRAGARAWACAETRPVQEIINNLSRSTDSARAYLTPAVRSLHAVAMNEFDSVLGDLSAAQLGGRAEVDLTGARALGYTYSSGEWRKIP